MNASKRRAWRSLGVFLRKPSWMRVLGTTVLALFAFSLMAWGSAQAQSGGATPDASSSADLDQCRNGALSDPTRCTDQPPAPPGQGWVNGNANGTQAHWAEGQSIAYRVRLSNLSAGAHTILIEYDYTAPSGKHSIDYLTSFNRTETDADVCTGVLSAGQCASANTLTIPVDPVLATCSTPQHAPGIDGGVPQVAGSFYLYGGTLVSASYVGAHACEGSSIKVQMRINFTIPAGGGNAVLAWGGHIAAEFDWGRGNSAHYINGSPYHMRLLEMDGHPTGNQDRALQNSAVYGTDLYTHIETNGTPAVNKPFRDTATVTGYQGKDIVTSPVIAGTLKFTICADTSVPFDPPSVLGCAAGAGTLVGTVNVNGNGTYLSPNYTPTANGYYCFRAEFTPASGQIYPLARDSNTLLTGSTAECVLVTGPTAISLAQFQARAISGQGAAGIVLLALLVLAGVQILSLRNRADS